MTDSFLSVSHLLSEKEVRLARESLNLFATFAENPRFLPNQIADTCSR